MNVQEAFTSINAEPRVIERYLTDPELLEQWRSPAIIIEPLEGGFLEYGSSYRLRVKSLALGGAVYRVVERDDEYILLEIDGLWRGTELWRWFGDQGRTVVQNRVEYEVPNESLRVFVVGIGNLLGQFDMQLQLTRLRQLIDPNGQPRPQTNPRRRQLTVRD